MPQVPQPGNRCFGADRGNAGSLIGGHLTHQHNLHQAFGSFGPGFSFPAMDNPCSEPSIGGPLSQSGMMTQLPVQGLSQTFHDGFSISGVSQDFGGDFKSQGSHVAYNVADFSTQACQSGYAVDFVTQGPQGGCPSYLNQNTQPGYTQIGTGNDFVSRDYMRHGSQGLFMQAGFNDSSQETSQSHFGGPGSLHSQGLMNPVYSQPFTRYNAQPLNQHPPHQLNRAQ